MGAYPTIQEIFDLSGKVAIVTGGAHGLGLAIVNRLSEAGASVMIADINVKGGKKAASELQGKGRKVEFIQADVRVPADAERAAKTTVKKFQGLDILVNNAGIYPMYPTLDLTEDEWDNVVDTDLKGTFFFSQAAAKAMIEEGKGGKMVNIASIGGLVGTELPIAMLAPYNAAKGGVVNLTRALAKEFNQYRINVNCVCPGAIVPNPGGGSGVPSRGMTAEKGALLMKAGFATSTTDEVARVVFTLATPISDKMQGVIVVVDGGTTLMHIDKFMPHKIEQVTS